MSHDDRVFLSQLNESSKESPKGTCSEDQFELVMEFFEETSSLKQPYATVANLCATCALDNLQEMEYTSRLSSGERQ